MHFNYPSTIIKTWKQVQNQFWSLLWWQTDLCTLFKFFSLFAYHKIIVIMLQVNLTFRIFSLLFLRTVCYIPMFFIGSTIFHQVMLLSFLKLLCVHVCLSVLYAHLHARRCVWKPRGYQWAVFLEIFLTVFFEAGSSGIYLPDARSTSTSNSHRSSSWVLGIWTWAPMLMCRDFLHWATSLNLVINLFQTILLLSDN